MGEKAIGTERQNTQLEVWLINPVTMTPERLHEFDGFNSRMQKEYRPVNLTSEAAATGQIIETDLGLGAKAYYLELSVSSTNLIPEAGRRLQNNFPQADLKRAFYVSVISEERAQELQKNGLKVIPTKTT